MHVHEARYLPGAGKATVYSLLILALIAGVMFIGYLTI